MITLVGSGFGGPAGRGMLTIVLELSSSRYTQSMKATKHFDSPTAGQSPFLGAPRAGYRILLGQSPGSSYRWSHEGGDGHGQEGNTGEFHVKCVRGSGGLVPESSSEDSGGALSGLSYIGITNGI